MAGRLATPADLILHMILRMKSSKTASLFGEIHEVMIDQIIVQILGCHTFKSMNNHVFQSAVIAINRLNIECTDCTFTAWNMDMA